jgi:hypothetical protein
MEENSLRLNVLCLAALSLSLSLLACDRLLEVDDVEDGGPDSSIDNGHPEYPASSVDILLVVTNSGWMYAEQEILSTNVFRLISEIVDPLPDSEGPALTDSLRVAVVTSDLGLQWGDNPYQEGDGWPGELPAGCSNIGDDGEFQTYSSGKTIDLQHNTIPCATSAGQCPTGWTCSATEPDQVGTCQAPGGDGTNQACPGFDAVWAETPVGPPEDLVTNDELAFQVACLTSLGTLGCGWEQPLQSAAIALKREEQDNFVRDDALLVVIAISDDQECSIENNSLFGEDEIQNLDENKVNLACGLHPQHLFPTQELLTDFAETKGGNLNAVLFAAVVGVPIDDACQGRGDQIGGCLDHPDMELVEVQYEDWWHFQPACEPEFDDPYHPSKPRPGRRFVELAQELGENGYVFSICNDDWDPAMKGIAAMIADELND